MESNVNQLKTFDRNVRRAITEHRDLKHAQNGSAQRHLPLRNVTHSLAYRGSAKSSVGLSDSGLNDLLRAHAHQQAPQSTHEDRSTNELLQAYLVKPIELSESWLEARLGETLRVYVRDILLSDKSATLESVAPTLVASIRCFSRALISANSKSRTWILAHRAAALTLLFWLDIASNPDFGSDSSNDQRRDDLGRPLLEWLPNESWAKPLLRLRAAELAESDFQEAQKDYAPDNPWCDRFYAFFRALRGNSGDFREASRLLQKHAPASGSRDPALERHRSMLAAYDTLDQNAEVNKRAANEALERGLCALQGDSEDCLASCFSTYALYHLAYEVQATSTEEAEEQSAFRKILPDAIGSARIRSYNAISQAYATLVTLALIEAQASIEAKQSWDPQVATQMLAHLQADFAPDLETRTMFYTLPLWSKIAAYARGEALEDDDDQTKRKAYIRLYDAVLPSFNAVRKIAVATKQRVPGATGAAAPSPAS